MLNTTHFTLLAGNPEPWDTEIKTRREAGEDLCALQVEQFGRGRRSAELVNTIYGFGVRSATGLDNRAILLSGRGHSKDEAIEWGINWANQDPEHREFFARNSTLEAVEA